jgi:hypothetical protein
MPPSVLFGIDILCFNVLGEECLDVSSNLGKTIFNHGLAIISIISTMVA